MLTSTIDGVLVETSVIIRYFRTSQRQLSLFERAKRVYDRLYLSTMTIYDVEFGAARDGSTSDLSAVLPYVEVLEINQQVAEQAAQLRSALISQNQNIGIQDNFIAATGLVHDFPVLTYNVNHFSRVPGLQVIPPF